MTMINLNEGQRSASLAIRRFLSKPIDKSAPDNISNRFFNLLGPGGTGKTTCVFQVLLEYLSGGKTVLFLAPTNKAVAVLKAVATSQGFNVECMTLAKSLGLALLPDEENHYIHTVGEPIVSRYDLLVIDEGSMVSARTLDHLSNALRGSNTKVLGMGDDYQLPPPKETRCELFDLGEQYKLNKVERNSGPILEFATYVRECIDRNARLKEIPAGETEESKVIHTLGKHFVTEAVRQVDVNDTDKTKILAWTNERVKELNRQVRMHHFGKSVPFFIEGEKVVTAGVIKDPEAGKVILPTDQECIVKAVVEDFIYTGFGTGGNEFKAFTLILQPVYGGVSDLQVQTLHPDSVDDWWSHLQTVAQYSKRTKDWQTYHSIRALASDIRHCYAITLHRSQGSTFDNAFVDIIDIQRQKNLKEQLKLIYVGSSRPRKLLAVNRNKFFV